MSCWMLPSWSWKALVTALASATAEAAAPRQLLWTLSVQEVISMMCRHCMES